MTLTLTLMINIVSLLAENWQPNYRVSDLYSFTCDASPCALVKW